MTIARRLLLLAALPVLVIAASAAIYFPAVVLHRFRPPGETALMELRAREAAATERPWEARHQWVPLASISPHLLRAVLAAEDTRFYEHQGFDLEQIRRAWEANRRRGEVVRGASTITQQTVKNLYLSPSRSLIRKMREALLTAWMELVVPKDRILELYLNIAELGPGIFGAEAAARVYFGHPAATLSREEAALLAATLPAPLDRNPARPTGGLRRRQALILARMERFFGDRPRLARERSTGDEDARGGRDSTAAAGPRVLPSLPIELPEAVPGRTDGAPAGIPPGPDSLSAAGP